LVSKFNWTVTYWYVSNPRFATLTPLLFLPIIPRSTSLHLAFLLEIMPTARVLSMHSRRTWR
jgi:hypothetical protein